MAKVITFSRTFPSYHPKAGEPTYFVEKFWTSIQVPVPCSKDQDQLSDEMSRLLMNDFRPKHHTIRKGNRFKVGEKFSPRVWSDKPYRSKQLILADDVQIVKIFNFAIDENGMFYIDGRFLKRKLYRLLAINDGLMFSELSDWFIPNQDKVVPFKGQIICWNSDVNYSN